MYELLINYIYYLKLKDYQKSNEYRKSLNKLGCDNNTIRALLTTKEIRATCFVISYYLYEFDLQILHDKLFKLFGNYKEAVTWLYNNDNFIVNSILKN